MLSSFSKKRRFIREKQTTFCFHQSYSKGKNLFVDSIFSFQSTLSACCNEMFCQIIVADRKTKLADFPIPRTQ